MSVPSIKGIAITRLVEDLRAYRDQSADHRDRLEARLSAAALEMLDEKIQPASWYPIDAYESLTQFIWETEGLRSIEYLRRRGADSAELVLATGMYQQITYLQERYNPVSFENLKRELRLVVTLQGAFFNFTTWQVTEDPDHEGRLQIEIRDAEHFPDVLAHATAGFVTRLGGEVSDNYLQWHAERPSQDRVVLRMDGDPMRRRASKT